MRNIVQELFQSWGFSLQRGSEEFPERGLLFGFPENYFFCLFFGKICTVLGMSQDSLSFLLTAS